MTAPNLASYLRAAGARSWTWGTHDCCTFGAGWFLLHGYADPMALFRGRYTTARGALRVIRRHGGLVDAVRYGMLDARVPEADEPRLGDMAVIERPTDDGLNQACALFGGERWVSLSTRGLDSGPGVPLAIWRP